MGIQQAALAHLERVSWSEQRAVGGDDVTALQESRSSGALAEEPERP
jgi:hypothetical protein